MIAAALNAGASPNEAARRAGMTLDQVKVLMEREDFQVVQRHYADEFARDVLPRVKFGREDAHHMYMTAFRNAANATEQIKATDSLVKLHRIDKEPDVAPEKEINNHRQLENMSVEELLRIAGYKLASLNPEGIEDAEVISGS